MPDIEEKKPKRGVHRSPNYPAFSLAEAISKAKVIYENEKRSYSTADVLAAHMGYAQAVGGPGGRAMSALRQYGLLEETDGKARVSEVGFALLHYPEGSPERVHAVNVAMREATLFSELLTEYPDGLPSDATLRSNLLRRGFNPAVIDDVVKNFRDTIALDIRPNVLQNAVQVGDYVQWLSQGVEQFDNPKRINSLSEDGCFAFFDGSLTGIPLIELEKRESPEESETGGISKGSHPKRIPPKPGMNNEVFTLEEGEVVLQLPSKLSKDSFQDLEDWLGLIIRKAKRASEKQESSEQE